MRLYECLEEPADVNVPVKKVLIPALNNFYLGMNYEYNYHHFISVKDVTEDYFQPGDLKRLNEDLKFCEWGDGERKLIVALVEQHMGTLKRFKKPDKRRKNEQGKKKKNKDSDSKSS